MWIKFWSLKIHHCFPSYDIFTIILLLLLWLSNFITETILFNTTWKLISFFAMKESKQILPFVAFFNHHYRVLPPEYNYPSIYKLLSYKSKNKSRILKLPSQFTTLSLLQQRTSLLFILYDYYTYSNYRVNTIIYSPFIKILTFIL